MASNCKHRQTQRPDQATSIPSSPTSIRSSSSAIFERDIEPIVSPSSPANHHHPHRIPRAKATEQLDQSVPSVLDSAATVLAGKDDVAAEIAVVSPAISMHELVGRNSGFASPIGSLRSRSPSPVGSKGTPSPRADVLLTIPVSILGLQNINPPPLTLPQPLKLQRPIVQTSVPDTFPSNSTSSSRQSSPKTTTLEHFPTTQLQYTHPWSPLTSPSTIASHPPSPQQLPKKRLSFMSYTDLLSSTPTTTQPLSSLTTCASATDPPPHIPGVGGLNVISPVYSSPSTSPGSRAPSIRTFPVAIPSTGALSHSAKRDSIALLGGEWEREGLGMGLEERLDALVLSNPPRMPIGGKA